MKATIGTAEHLQLFDELKAVLARYDPVTQQTGIEIIAANHCLQMGDLHGALTAAAGIHKHTLQLIEQRTRFLDETGC